MKYVFGCRLQIDNREWIFLRGYGTLGVVYVDFDLIMESPYDINPICTLIQYNIGGFMQFSFV